MFTSSRTSNTSSMRSGSTRARTARRSIPWATKSSRSQGAAKRVTSQRKVVLLAPVAHARHDTSGNRTFDGELNIWSFVEYVPAWRNSRNGDGDAGHEGEMRSRKRSTRKCSSIRCCLPATREHWWESTKGIVTYCRQDILARTLCWTTTMILKTL